MLTKIYTKEQATEYRYGKWAGNPKGNKYNENRCAYSVRSGDSWIPTQCSRKNGKGINGLYCSQHAKMIMKNIKEAI